MSDHMIHALRPGQEVRVVSALAMTGHSYNRQTLFLAESGKIYTASSSGDVPVWRCTQATQKAYCKLIGRPFATLRKVFIEEKYASWAKRDQEELESLKLDAERLGFKLVKMRGRATVEPM